MEKLRLQIVKLGTLNTWLDLSKLMKWRSRLFEVLPEVNQHRLPTRAEGPVWNFSDNQISRAVPRRIVGNVLLVLTDAPLEGNYYMRRLSGNRVCISFFQVRDILARDNVPVENYVLRSIYEVLIYYTIAMNHGGELQKSAESYTHDETKGCLFDMTGNKADLTVSCRAPNLCDTCYADLSRDGVATNILDIVRHELKRVRPPTYLRMLSVVKRRPIMSLIITALSAILLNILSTFIMKLFE